MLTLIVSCALVYDRGFGNSTILITCSPQIKGLYKFDSYMHFTADLPMYISWDTITIGLYG